jgi:hypothetical protein
MTFWEALSWVGLDVARQPRAKRPLAVLTRRGWWPKPDALVSVTGRYDLRLKGLLTREDVELLCRFWPDVLLRANREAAP